MTLFALKTIEQCQVIIGYDTYIDLIKHLLKPSQEVVRAGMTEEVYRAQKTIELAKEGKIVGVISSGDAGLYGMAGLIFEVLHKMQFPGKIDVQVVPGVTALISAASLLGAPVMHDFCAISLSDHLTPWNTIEKRLVHAAMGDFVLTLYNPKSSRRKEQINIAQNILLQYRNPENPVGIVTSAYRPDQNIVITDLNHMLEFPAGMMTTILIGNSQTRVIDGKMITPRGYQKKYQLHQNIQDIKKSDRMNITHEPWALQKEKQNSEMQTGLEINLMKNIPKRVLHKYYIKTKGSLNQSSADSEKILNAGFLSVLGKFLSTDSRIEATPDGRLFLLCHEIDIETMEKLDSEGLYLYDDEEYILIKTCNFCDGEKPESLVWLDILNKSLADIHVPGQLHIGFNGCGMSCHGAVMEDIGIVYFRGEFEVYIGGKKMGRNVRLPLHTHLHLSGEEMISIVMNLVARYKNEGFEKEKFFKYILRVSGQVV